MAVGLTTILCCIVTGTLLRWSVALFPYSGEHKPPRFGDYEAHRHWMEVTHNLPLREWYVGTPRNNLEYWGLDYPPLSAYHSYAVGLMFENIIPESIELDTSRGYESDLHKFMMRASVYMSDVLIFALVFFHVRFSGETTFPAWCSGETTFPAWSSVLLAVAAPPFILVDYGHFQYNCVSLGLTVIAVNALLSNHMSLAAISFTLAVNHKQMSLYHAIPFAAYMFGKIVVKRGDFLTCFRVGTTILSTIGLLWLPFGDRVFNVLHRIFPLKRGVYEDKVGTFWYMFDRVFRVKDVIPDATFARICAVVCLAFLAPIALQVFYVSASKNRFIKQLANRVFILGMLNISLVFFLFSYHVHEKTIMLPSLGAVLLLPWYPRVSVWFITVATLSMYPLFYEENSFLALILLTVLYLLIAQQLNLWYDAPTLAKLAFVGSVGIYVVVIAAYHLLAPPTKYPDLYPVLIAMYSFIHFVLFFGYFQWEQFTMLNDAMEESNKKKHL